jgi:hypothetical protein
MGSGVVLQMEALAPGRVNSITMLSAMGQNSAARLSPESRDPRTAAGETWLLGRRPTSAGWMMRCCRCQCPQLLRYRGVIHSILGMPVRC